MIPAKIDMLPLERLVARLLSWGTWAGGLVIALGLLMALFGEPEAESFVMAGTAIFLMLPVARLSVMLVAFVRGGDYRFALISFIVLAIIAIGLVVGMRT